MLKELNESLDAVIYLNVNEDEIVRRLSLRRICPKCGRVYNLIANPPKNNEICDVCHVTLVRRKNDKPEVVRNRLRVYESSTKPIIEIYRKGDWLSI